MKKIFFGLLSVLILTLFSCNSKEQMPYLQKSNSEALKTIKIDGNFQVASLRSVPIVGSYNDPNNLNSRKVSIDWGNDTWDNGANRPKLIVTVGDNVYEVPNGNYDYKKSSAQGASSVHIAYDLKYATDADKVNFYLVDKATAVDMSAKTIDFTDQNGKELIPLNTATAAKPKFNFIFASKTTISDIKTQMQQNKKIALPFTPKGTLLLFDATAMSGKTTTLKFATNCFDTSGKIDMISGMGKNNVTTEVKPEFTAKRGDQNKSIYGLYVLGRSIENGKISLAQYDGTEYSDRQFNITPNFFSKFDMKYVNLNMLPRESEREYFESEWSGSDKIVIEEVEGNDVFARYREKGTGNWSEVKIDTRTGRGVLNITGLDATKTYELRLFGTYWVRILTNLSGTNTSLKKITHWGTTRWKTFFRSFQNCRELDVVADDVPNMTSGNMNCQMMFHNCMKLVGNEQFGKWTTTNITDMNQMFQNCESFNQDISKWDVSNVKNMRAMFNGAKVFNQPLNDWDVSNVTNMGYMFQKCELFNQPLDKWATKVSKVTDMMAMFNATKFDQDISNWDVSNVTNMSNMFESTPFNKPLNGWNVSKVTNMAQMFQSATAFDQPLNNWKTSSCTNMRQMFNGAKTFNQDISNWDVTKVKYVKLDPTDPNKKNEITATKQEFINNMFNGCPLSTQVAKQPKFQ